MDLDKQPGISFDGIFLLTENFYRIPSMPDKLKIDINFSMVLNSSNDSFSNELTTNLVCFSEDNEKVLNFEFTFVGIFSVISEEKNMDIKHFMEHNSPAIIFPYIREHITNITQKAGINPILLPPVNILAMTKGIKNNIK
ncbi:hypothetical protein CBEIBR21_06560 [Clostridium beijerinckii]|uniref:Preprotein translocase subunit SecB n=1 Tax=Clostridium beijerinckii TaxID=1520 RepID=A0A1S9NAV1_CLOBE|nr:hypothetical protein CBEIBR21_06560 [Clostridium beijerinckii]